MRKKNMIPFFIGLVCGLLVVGLILFSNGKVKPVNASIPAANDPYSSLKMGWSEAVEKGRLDFASIQAFMEREKIKLVAFINENGGYLISNANGEEFQEEQWCQLSGTKVSGKCPPFKDGSRLATFNQMVTFATEASPRRVWVNIGGGNMICVDLSTGRLCD